MDSIHIGATSGLARPAAASTPSRAACWSTARPPRPATALFFNDQTTTANQTFRVDNAITGSRTLVSGSEWPVDTTTVTRSGWDAGSVQYRGIETAVINAGQRR
jgi:hypothetical protein